MALLPDPSSLLCEYFNGSHLHLLGEFEKEMFRFLKQPMVAELAWVRSTASDWKRPLF